MKTLLAALAALAVFFSCALAQESEPRFGLGSQRRQPAVQERAANKCLPTSATPPIVNYGRGATNNVADLKGATIAINIADAAQAKKALAAFQGRGATRFAVGEGACNNPTPLVCIAASAPFETGPINVNDGILSWQGIGVAVQITATLVDRDGRRSKLASWHDAFLEGQENNPNGYRTHNRADAAQKSLAASLSDVARSSKHWRPDTGELIAEAFGNASPTQSEADRIRAEAAAIREEARAIHEKARAEIEAAKAAAEAKKEMAKAKKELAKVQAEANKKKG
jgi:hypothetical protein